MSKILVTGTATIDIVNTVDRYPGEDDKVRATASRTANGGNAANTAVVLASMGHRSHLCAVLADDTLARHLREVLQDTGVELRHCPERQGATPTSYITLSAATGSRTIVHYRELPELDTTDFARIPLEEFDWLHFEGRNVQATAEQMRLARRRLQDQPISVEIEKDHHGIPRLFAHADVLLLSRAYARSQGFDSADALLIELRPLAPQAILVCAWGEEGAWALAPGDRRRIDCAYAPACAVGPVVDTLGAGDTFNAGIIDALAGGAMLEEALAHANRLAGEKVGREGLL